MCGIAGIIQPGGVVGPLEIERMTATLRHRGPDAGGYYVDGKVALGHRRLSIIDTHDHANQPLFNEDGRVAVVFNGEIYNFQTLRKQLEQRGHRFATNSDTEVIVHAWEEYGESCVNHFRGMFAFGLYDRSHQTVFLARDRVGQKPLYYSHIGGSFAFASEIKALRTLTGFDDSIDIESLGHYAAYGNTAGGHSIYRSVRCLRPGHTALIDLKAPEIRPSIRRYWNIEYAPDHTLTEAQWIERFDAVFEEAVRLRLISDVPLGAFLSGGVDSTLVVLYIAKHLGRNIRTFTMGFSEQRYDESSDAEEVARFLRTDHTMQRVTPDAVSVLDHLIDAYDEPFADESAIPTYYLCEATRQHVTVALSGDGGDELFAGYRRYWESWLLHRAGTCITPAGRAAARWTSRRLSPSSRMTRPLARMGRHGFGLYHHAMGFDQERLALLRPEVREQLPDECLWPVAEAYGQYGPRPEPDRYAYADLLNYLTDDVLVKVDRASMHHSLEVRSPMLDHEVIQLAAQIPLAMKLRGMTGKRILRTILRRDLPRRLVERPKRGFGIPLDIWFRQNGSLRDRLRDLLANRNSPTWDVLDRRVVEDRLAKHERGGADLRHVLWRAIVYDAWVRANQSHG